MNTVLNKTETVERFLENLAEIPGFKNQAQGLAFSLMRGKTPNLDKVYDLIDKAQEAWMRAKE